MIKLLPCRFQQCLEPFSMLIVERCFEARPFSLLFNHLFGSPLVRKHRGEEGHFLFQNDQNLIQILEMREYCNNVITIFLLISLQQV